MSVVFPLIVLLSYVSLPQESRKIKICALVQASADQYIRKTQVDSIAFSIQAISSPPNFFIAFGGNNDPYIHFAEAPNGLAVYSQGRELYRERTIATTLGTEYQITVEGKKILRNGVEIYEIQGERSDTLSIGAFRAQVCIILDTADGWQPMAGSWDLPETIVYDTLRAQKATVSWDPNSESDLSGYIVRYRRDDNNPADSTVFAPDTSLSITVETGSLYEFSVAAFDTAGNRSDFTTVPRKVYIAAKDSVTAPCLPDSLVRYDLTDDCILNMDDHKKGWPYWSDFIPAPLPDSLKVFDLDGNGLLDIRDGNLFISNTRRWRIR